MFSIGFIECLADAVQAEFHSCDTHRLPSLFPGSFSLQNRVILPKSCSLRSLAAPLQDSFFTTLSVYISLLRFPEHFLVEDCASYGSLLLRVSRYILHLLTADSYIISFLISFHSHNSSQTFTLAYRRTVAGTTPATASYTHLNVNFETDWSVLLLGVKAWWTLRTEVKPPSLLNISDEKRYFEIIFHKKDKGKIFEAYLPQVIAEAKIMELKKRQRKIYTNIGGNSQSHPAARSSSVWTPMVFEHPATFQTLALHPDLKDDIIQDLRIFSQREKYYKDVGRAWKRGYLLYGPPGTGKSTMIAAIANFLEYDIYDLELSEVKSNTELRSLLIGTTNRSVIVIEDIDCSLDLSGRVKKAEKESRGIHEIPAIDESGGHNSKVTLSGDLNFTDGLWSCCCSERIIIFTTNHVDRLDPALLRSGRMDKHIHLSFCTFPAFKVLARNYLGVEDHPLFEQVEVLMKEAQMTPADVSEELMRVTDDPTAALEKLIEALRRAMEKAAVKNEILPETESEEADLVEEEAAPVAIMSDSSDYMKMFRNRMG
ncbi:AAA-ATPase At3g28580-like [Cryptomeria japonica]|uniref:AAA-ATPase At3g28580-like n=1 Tax=Cryptomeria japonica TaxID=3369 RepID=UPI0027DA6000|nr:AAA-ATPase At3g28580-like [Cryptomeria japonica]